MYLSGEDLPIVPTTGKPQRKAVATEVAKESGKESKRRGLGSDSFCLLDALPLLITTTFMKDIRV